MKYKLKTPITHNPAECIAELLRAKGVEDIDGYVNPSSFYELDPENLDNIYDGAQLLMKHLNNNSKILFVVDCDCDGFMSSAILYLYLKNLYPDANFSYVCHEHKAHGVEDMVDYIIDSDFDLIIEPDAGSSEADLHKLIKEAGKDILVLDHHQYENNDEYAIIINNQSSKDYPNKSLCGAGVVYKFCQYMDFLNETSYAEQYMDLCSVALIGDVMSFKYPETRYYVTEGLKNIVNGGLKEMIKAQSFSLFKYSKELTPVGVAFYIVPLINAIVRVGTDDEKRMMFEMLINPDKKVQTNKQGAKKGDMIPIGEELCRIATNTRSRQNRIKDKAVEMLDTRLMKSDRIYDKILIIEVEPQDKIPQELTGLIAQQFLSKYNRPSILVRRSNDGYLRGSIRGSDTFEEVNDFRQFLLDSGLVEGVFGHPNAAGVEIKASNEQKLIDYANQHISDKGLDSSYEVDFIFERDESFSNTVLAIANASNLWGNDVKEPMIVAENIPFNSSNVMIMGENKSSVKFTYNGVEYVRFKDADFAQLMSGIPLGVITVYGKCMKNTWAGRTTAQIVISDYNISELEEVEPDEDF